MLTSLARSCRMLMFVCSREEDEAEFLKFCFVSFSKEESKTKCFSRRFHAKARVEKSKCVSSFSGITVYIYINKIGEVPLC